MLCGETANTNCIVIYLAQLWLKPMIHHTLGKHSNHDSNVAMWFNLHQKNWLFMLESHVFHNNTIFICFLFKFQARHIITGSLLTINDIARSRRMKNNLQVVFINDGELH